jgi:hypothetical protein
MATIVIDVAALKRAMKTCTIELGAVTGTPKPSLLLDGFPEPNGSR